MKASIATAILAFCATNTIAAPAAQPQLDVEKREAEPVFAIPLAAKVGLKAGFALGKKLFFDKRDELEVEKREPALPIAAKLGVKVGLKLGKELFFDKRDVQEIEKREPVLPLAAKVGIKAGFAIGKKLFFDKRDELELAKREPALPIAAKVGIKAGLQLGKKLFFDDKKKRDAFIEFKPFDDDPFNPFDDEGVIGKRHPLTVVEGSDVSTEWDGIAHDRREAQGGFKEGLNNVIQWWGKEVGDDSPINPFDDPGLPGKRNAEPEPFIKDIIGVIGLGDEDDDTSFNPLDGKLDIFRRMAEADPQGFKQKLGDALRWWAKEVNDDSPLNPFDDPGLPGKRNAEAEPQLKEKLGDALRWWAAETQDDSPLNPFDDPGLPGKRNAEAEPFLGDVVKAVGLGDENDDTSFNPLDGALNILRR